jgi:chromosomal replication initiation ATPase DnaA
VFKPEDIVETVIELGQHAGLQATAEDVYGRSRAGDVPTVRALAAHSLRELAGYGAPRIGRLLGRDPSSVTTLMQRLRQRYSADELRRLVDAVEDELSARTEKQLTLF